MKLSLMLALVAVVIPRSVLAQLTPASPVNPTEYSQCRALYNSWQIVRTEGQTKHDDCLKRNNAYLREWNEKKDGTCVIGECQQWHASWWWGRDEVKECEDEVSAYLKEIAKQEKEEKAAEEERADAEKKAKAAQRKADEDTRKENEQKARTAKELRESDEAAKASRADDAFEREKARRQGDADRRAEQQAREKASADRLAQAERSAEIMQNRVQKNREQREADAAELASKSADNRSDVSALVAGTAALVGAAVDGMKGAFAAARVSVGPSDATSDFDMPTDGERLKKASDHVWEKLGTLVPFAEIPFKIVTNIAVQTTNLSDQLTRTIANFEEADPAELEAAFAEFPEKAYGVRPVVQVIVDKLSGDLKKQFEDKFIDPVKEEAKTRARLAIKNRDASALLDDDPGPQASVVFWWEGKSSSSRSKALRDHNGTVILFDRKGTPINYDASLERATYNASDVEGLVANSDLSVRRSTPTIWTRKAVIINPIQVPPKSSLVQKGIDKAVDKAIDKGFDEWVAGAYAAFQLKKLEIPDYVWQKLEPKH
jgi:hypothetical protein